jgi:NADH dehydrogenase [ubiquinone] 1 alpha subcomplex assembly factor 5
VSNQIFNRRLLKMRRNRVAPNFEDFLKAELCERLADRLEDITRDFPVALELGCHSGQLQRVLGGRGGIQRLVQCDLAEQMVRAASGDHKLVADEEFLPFAPESFDLVMSAGSLHWVNDLPGTLVQIRRILKPDGLFLAVLPGPNSLRFVEVRDAGNLLARAGFALPVADHDTLNLTYEHPLKLLRELKAMGENNHLISQEKAVLSKSFFAELCEHYLSHYALDNGRISATIELVTLTSWAPHESQQQPARRGSGQVSMKDFLS